MALTYRNDPRAHIAMVEYLQDTRIKREEGYNDSIERMGVF